METVTGLGEIHGQSRVPGFSTRGADAQHLVQCSSHDDAVQLCRAERQREDLSRVRLGRLSVARNPLLQLVERARLEERPDQRWEHTHLMPAVIIFAQRRRGESIVEQIHGLLKSLLRDRNQPQTQCRFTFRLEEAVFCTTPNRQGQIRAPVPGQLLAILVREDTRDCGDHLRRGRELVATNSRPPVGG